MGEAESEETGGGEEGEPGRFTGGGGEEAGGGMGAGGRQDNASENSLNLTLKGYLKFRLYNDPPTVPVSVIRPLGSE